VGGHKARCYIIRQEGLNGYDGKPDNGQIFMGKTLKIVSDIISGNTEKYKAANNGA